MILTELNRYYQRLSKDSKVLPEGYSKKKISYVIVLSADGRAIDLFDIREVNGKKIRPKLLDVPQLQKRTSISPAFFWDNTAYVLGVTGNEKDKKLQDKHDAFKKQILNAIEGETDKGLIALQKFLQTWSPEKFYEPPFSDIDGKDVLDTNIVFQLDEDKRQYLHDRLAAKELWQTMRNQKSSGEVAHIASCLVTGKKAVIARLHQPIEGVRGAQPSGANIVSFKPDAFNSYGKKKSFNAPVSEMVADQYIKALNFLLRSENNRSVNIGDTTTVFWAEAEGSEQSDQAENFLGALLKPTDDQETGELQRFLTDVSKGRPLQDIKPELDPNTDVYVLGLSPNASRLSIRFWQPATLDIFVRRIAQHYRDLELKPLAWKTPPSIRWLLRETTPSRNGKHDSKDILPHLAGEVMRAIISGGNYPYSLLTSLVMRMRTDGKISGLRVALCKAVIARKMRINNMEENLVSLNKDSKNLGYLLGRLFAELENAQRGALGKDTNTTIKDQYYGSASANPAATFPTLIRKCRHHEAKLRKENPGMAVNIDKRISKIFSKIDADNFPKTLNIEDQGRFAIGYYHQHASLFQKKAPASSQQQ